MINNTPFNLLSGITLSTMNLKGRMINAYSPFQNLMDETGTLTDFTTKSLNFDLAHPVDLLVQPAYDGAVNLIINDNKNIPRLINSRFSVQNDTDFLIPDHYGFKDTNVYDSQTFDVDTALKTIMLKYPTLEYLGTNTNSGNLLCGAYSFYFKLLDADGNESSICAESGVILITIGSETPSDTRMGLQDENTRKSVSFILNGIDSGYDYIKVLYVRKSSSDNGALATSYFAVDLKYVIKNSLCEITVTGSESIRLISELELYVDFATIQYAKTQAVNNNVLLFGNVGKKEHNYELLRLIAWLIRPSEVLSGKQFSITSDYVTLNFFYNSKTAYNHVGYWPDEIYQFGIVFVFTDNSFSDVFPLLGCNFDADEEITDTDFFDKLPKDLETSEQTYGIRKYLPYNSELPETGYFFDIQKGINAKGVIKFSKKYFKDTIKFRNNEYIYRPLGINFKLTNIGYVDTGLQNNVTVSSNGINLPNTDWKTIFKTNDIMGFFFVRKRRIPSILCLAVSIGLLQKDYGALPIIQEYNSYKIQSFLGGNNEAPMYNFNKGDETSNRNALLEEGSFIVLTQNIVGKALLCPEAELNEATYNSLFNSNKYACDIIGTYYPYNGNTNKHIRFNNFNLYDDKNKSLFSSKLTFVPEDTVSLTNGTDFFSTVAGNPDEPYKTSNVATPIKKIVPLLATYSNAYVRGNWGSFVGSSYNFPYGSVINIKDESYYTNENAVNLFFQKYFTDSSPYHAISKIYNIDDVENDKVTCYRGDCFPVMYTHRMLRNFIDPETPTNNKIINPLCWRENYAVRCTAVMTSATHSNLTSDNEGFYIPETDAPWYRNPRLGKKFWLLLITGLIPGAIMELMNYKNGTTEEYSLESLGLSEDKLEDEGIYKGTQLKKDGKIIYPDNKGEELNVTIEIDDNKYYRVTKKLEEDGENIQYNIELIQDIAYKDGYANEIVLAFESYTGSSKFKKGYRKKLLPAEQGVGGFIKALFKPDTAWDLHGLASINRSDVNAVGIGLWITFPILSNKNLALRDIDYSNVDEQAKMNRKRGFYPFYSMDVHNHLADSHVINEAAGITLPDKKYWEFQEVPFIKQEYFTRVYNSLKDSADNYINEFKLIYSNCFKDYDKIYGTITKLISVHNGILVVFSHGILLMQLNLSGSAEEFCPVNLTDISVDFGSIWKDSVMLTPQGVYGVDSVAKKIWRYNNSGSFEIISDHKVGKFLIDNIDMSEFANIPYIGHINIKTHYNAFKNDVIFTYYNDLLFVKNNQDWVKRYLTDEHLQIEAIRENENTSIAQVINLDIILNAITGEEVDNTDPEDILWKTGNHWSLCYNETLQKFVTFYDWYPVESANINNIWFSFDRDAVNNPEGKFVTEDVDLCLNLLGYKRSIFKVNKQTVDPAFNYKCSEYYCNSNLNKKLRSAVASDSEHSFILFTCYLRDRDPDESLDVTVQLFTRVNKSGLITLYNTDFKDENGEHYYIIDPCVRAWHNETDMPADVKKLFDEVDNGGSNTKKFPIEGLSQMGLRNTRNSIKLWKHGYGGNYDNEGKILPTNWYGKQHEFNFEFVVNDTPTILKIFNNLKLISSKVEPMKFEYEVVGEGYEWYEYKKIIGWIHNAALKEVIKEHPTESNIDNYLYSDDGKLNKWYKEVLSTKYEKLRSTYSDFPFLFNFTEDYITKLPYLKVKEANSPGIYYFADGDGSAYRAEDSTAHPIEIENYKEHYRDGNNAYSENTSDTTLVYDEQLNEYRIRTELLMHNVKKYGRVRGNSEYKEDLWDVEIRPISFKWAYLKDEKLTFSKIQEARLRDKYCKVKVRYSGEDLAVILAILTMFDYSYA